MEKCICDVICTLSLPVATLLSLIFLSVAQVPGAPDVEEETQEAPVIIEQPPRRVLAVVGEDLTLRLKVKGEQPLRYSNCVYVCGVQWNL